jgi:hypothetical protein
VRAGRSSRVRTRGRGSGTWRRGRAGAPDRAAPVPAHPDGHHAARDGGCGATAGPARGAADVPRVVRDAARDGLGERPRAELGHRRRGDDDRAGSTQAPHDLRVLGRRGRVPLTAEGGDAAGDRDLLLDDDGYAVQGAELRSGLLRGVPGVRLGARLVGEQARDRVQPRVAGGDAIECGIGGGPRGELAARDQPRGLDHACGAQVGHGRDPKPVGVRPGTPAMRCAGRSSAHPRPR